MANVRDPRGVRAQKLTYLGLGLGAFLFVAMRFLPTSYQSFLLGVIVGMFLFCALLLSNLFWRGQL
jgi:hypothetical protein